jgi:uncharacterized protein YbjT (DUF2867 family)
MGKKILVVGATSKIGTELVKALVAKGEAVKAATRHPGEYEGPPGVEATAFDYDASATMEPALADVDRVFMVSKWTDEHPEFKLNRLVERARVENVSHIVLLTSKAIDPATATRLNLVEKHVADSGIGYTILHPNWYMQNFTRGMMHIGISAVGMIAVPAANAAVSFVDARDVAEVTVAALTDPKHAGQTYDLTGGEALTYNQVADILTDVARRPIGYDMPSDQEVHSLLTANMWESEDVDHVLGLFQYVRAGQAAAVNPTLGTLLGRAPTTFEQFARDHMDAWK